MLGGVEMVDQVLEERTRGCPRTAGGVNRAMRRAASGEVARMERYLPFLATTASSAPFIGLFGTVWGVMSAFQGIGAQGSASLAVVAPASPRRSSRRRRGSALPFRRSSGTTSS